MGTDVYLEWDGKTEEEKQAQITGWSSDAGDVGYLRASIGMANENALLRMMFPEKYWKDKAKDGYDFKANLGVLNELGLKYLLCVATGKKFEAGKEAEREMEKQREQGTIVLKAAVEAAKKQSGSEEIKVSMPGISTLREAVRWLNSVFEFFELGIEKQKKGLKPYPYISW